MKTLWNDGIKVIKCGRNEPCPCGTTIRFKWCCLDIAKFPVLVPKGMTGKNYIVHALKKEVRKIQSHFAYKRMCAKRYNAKMKRKNHVEQR